MAHDGPGCAATDSNKSNGGCQPDKLDKGIVWKFWPDQAQAVLPLMSLQFQSTEFRGALIAAVLQRYQDSGTPTYNERRMSVLVQQR